MITCSPTNFVIGLGAPSQFLSGNLSGAIGNLTNLQQVLLQNNNIFNKFPSELGRLPKLQTLDPSNNRFSGLVPGSLGQLNGLQCIRRLNNNSLSGPFPLSLSKISQLAFFICHYLSLNDKCDPPGGCRGASSRDLSYNNPSGPVPKFPARTFNIVGNPLIYGSSSVESCSTFVTPFPHSFSLQSSPGKH